MPLAAVFLLASILLDAVPAPAQELRGFFDTSYSLTTSESSQTGTADFETNRQSLDINWNKRVTPFLGYRLTLRGERTDASITANDDTTDTTALLLQPLADFTLASPGYSLNAGLRLRELFTESSTENDRRLSDRNYFARFFFTPQNLPSASLIFDRTTSVDDLQTRDTVDTRYQASAQYSRGDFNGSYTYSRLINEDAIQHRTRTQDSHLANLGYSSLWFGDQLAVQANASGNRTTTTEEFSVPGTAVVDRPLARGLRADADATPENSMDVPVVTAPGLASGGGKVPLPLFVAVGFELVAREAISSAEIVVAPEPPFTLPTNLGSFVSFRVFASDDTTLATWTEVTGVSQTYDSQRNRFMLTFTATTARFFKVFVARNDFGALVVATGVVAGTTIAVQRGTERVTRNLSGTLTSSLTYTPVTWATASYNLTLSGNRQEPGDFTTWSGTHAVNVTVDAHRFLTVGGTFQYSFSESDQPGFLSTSATAYTLKLGSNPLPTLTSALVLGRSENRVDDALQNRTDTANLTVSARVLPKLNADSTLSVSRGTDFVNDQDFTTQGFSLNLNAQILPRINTVMNYSVLRQEFSPPIAGQASPQVTHAIGGGTTYTISRVLNFTTRFDYSLSPVGTAFIQNYKLDWVPTSKTSLFVNYRAATQDAQGIEGGSHSVSLNGRWNVSRFLDLNANYSYTRTTSGDIVLTVQSFNVAAGFRF